MTGLFTSGSWKYAANCLHVHIFLSKKDSVMTFPFLADRRQGPWPWKIVYLFSGYFLAKLVVQLWIRFASILWPNMQLMQITSTGGCDTFLQHVHLKLLFSIITQYSVWICPKMFTRSLKHQNRAEKLFGLNN